MEITEKKWRDLQLIYCRDVNCKRSIHNKSCVKNARCTFHCSSLVPMQTWRSYAYLAIGKIKFPTAQPLLEKHSTSRSTISKWKGCAQLGNKVGAGNSRQIVLQIIPKFVSDFVSVQRSYSMHGHV